MPDATNVIPELVKVGIQKETTWATAPGGTPVLLPVEPPDIKEEIAHIVDENIRGVLARDFEAYGGRRQVTGSLSGIAHLTEDADAGATLEASFAHVLAAFFGGTEAGILTAGPNYLHNFYFTEDPYSLEIQVEDSLTGSGTTPVYKGVLIPKLTLKYDGGEGLLTWDADLLGQRQTFPASPTAIGADKSGKAMIGWQTSVHFGTAAANPTAIAKLLSAEITFEREIALVGTAANQQYANRIAARAPRVTFTAVVEFQSYADYQLYSKDLNDGSTAFTDYTANQQAWTFRFTTITRATSNITTATADTSLDLAADVPAGDAVFDVRLHAVSYGESPLVLSRGEFPNRMEFSGRALYDKTATPTGWFGAVPGTAATLLGQRLVQVRLVNQRETAY